MGAPTGFYEEAVQLCVCVRACVRVEKASPLWVFFPLTVLYFSLLKFPVWVCGVFVFLFFKESLPLES